MNRLMIATAAAALLAGPALAVDRMGESDTHMRIAQAAPAVPETAIGVQERRNQLVDDKVMPANPAAAAPAPKMMPDVGTTGTVGTTSTLGVTSDAPVEPETAIGVQENRNELLRDGPAK